MPIYEYECQACGAVFDELQGLSDPQPKTCKVCQKGPVRRLISRSGFVLKGSGFYTNEHPSSSMKEGLKSEK
jgi:putative FmdB family regulatory protein